MDTRGECDRDKKKRWTQTTHKPRRMKFKEENQTGLVARCLFFYLLLLGRLYIPANLINIYELWPYLCGVRYRALLWYFLRLTNNRVRHRLDTRLNFRCCCCVGFCVFLDGVTRLRYQNQMDGGAQSETNQVAMRPHLGSCFSFWL